MAPLFDREVAAAAPGRRAHAPPLPPWRRAPEEGGAQLADEGRHIRTLQSGDSFCTHVVLPVQAWRWRVLDRLEHLLHVALSGVPGAARVACGDAVHDLRMPVGRGAVLVRLRVGDPQQHAHLALQGHLLAGEPRRLRRRRELEVEVALGPPPSGRGATRGPPGRTPEPADVLGVRAQGGELGAIALIAVVVREVAQLAESHAPQPGQQGAPAPVRRRAHEGSATASAAGADEVVLTQGAERLSNGHRRHAEAVREVALRRQRAAVGKQAERDGLAQPPGDGLRAALGLEGREHRGIRTKRQRRVGHGLGGPLECQGGWCVNVGLAVAVRAVDPGRAGRPVGVNVALHSRATSCR